MNTRKNIAILAGGDSAEYGISIKSANVVAENLAATFNTFIIIIQGAHWFYQEGGKEYNINKSDFSLTRDEKTIHFDLAFIAIHGTPGEDGKLQGYFDMLGIRYSASNQLASALSFNKGVCNDYLKQQGIKCAESVQLFEGKPYNASAIIAQLGLPCFVKPNKAGSSYGVSKVKKEDELAHAISEAFTHDDQVMIESFLDGREVTCGVNNFNGEPTAMPVTEIITTNEFFDFEAKYKGESQEITPAQLPIETTKKVQAAATHIFQLLGLNAVARVDFIIQNGEPFMIEANTVPGLSSASLIPQQAVAMGYTLPEFFTAWVNYCLKSA